MSPCATTTTHVLKPGPLVSLSRFLVYQGHEGLHICTGKCNSSLRCLVICNEKRQDYHNGHRSRYSKDTVHCIPGKLWSTGFAHLGLQPAGAWHSTTKFVLSEFLDNTAKIHTYSTSIQHFNTPEQNVHPFVDGMLKSFCLYKEFLYFDLNSTDIFPQWLDRRWNSIGWDNMLVPDKRQAFIWTNHYIDVIMTTMTSQITSLTVVYSTVYSDADQRKHQSSASLAFLWGIHRDRWIPRTKGQLLGKYFHLMTSSYDGLISQRQSIRIGHWVTWSWWVMHKYPEIKTF